VPPPGSASPLGLNSAVGGDGKLRFEWRLPSPDDPEPSMALLLTDETGPPFGSGPVVITPGTSHMVIDGLPNGHLFSATLGMSPGGGPFAAVGPKLSVRTGPPVYVDIAAAPGGSGSTPGTAFNDLILAVLIAFSSGGGNVWVAEGDYANMSLPLFGGVDVYGGFPRDFALESRDAASHPTRLIGLPDLPVASMLNTNSLTILDGLHLVGNDLASIGLEIEDSPFEGRALQVSSCKRGIKFRRGPFSDIVEMSLTACSSRNNQLQGLSAEGPVKLLIDGCAFSGNGQEGFETAGWLAPDGLQVRLLLRDCSFSGNGGEGVDIDMVAPSAGGLTGGKFDLDIESCTAQTNALEGFLVDIDYETTPTWYAEIVLRGCYARGNGGAGIHLDLDSNASVLVHRVACTANRAEGLLVTSETQSGTLTVSASAFLGNQGAGILSTLGNFGLLASHCVLSGNNQGGVSSSPAPASAVSSIAYLQPTPWAGTHVYFCPGQPDPDPTPFLNAPRGFAQITAVAGSALTLNWPPSGPMDAIAEVSDDGVPRSILSVGGYTIQVDPVASGIVPPQPLSFFAPGSDAIDDYTLSPSSVAIAAGMPPIAGGSSDAGPHGAPKGGVPGSEDLLMPELFYFANSSPTWVHPISPSADLELSFSGGTPEPNGAPLFVQVVDADSTPLLVSTWVADGVVHLAAPVGGWPQGASIQLHRRLPAVAGTTLASPVVIPLQVL
jgi:hypothetical protein